MTRSDETGTVEVVVSGLQVDAVRVSNLWKDRFDAETLASTISTLVRETLPPRKAPERIDPGGDKHLPVGAVAGFTAELRAGRRATRRYIERLRAGEVQKHQETRLTEQDRVEVSVVGGRFNALLINPDWAKDATVQSLCDTILDVLNRVPLMEEPELDPDLAEAQRHYDAARRHLANK